MITILGAVVNVINRRTLTTRTVGTSNTRYSHRTVLDTSHSSMLPQCVCISILLSNNEPQTDPPTLRGGRTTLVSSLHTSCLLDRTPTVAQIIIIIIQGLGILGPGSLCLTVPQHERNNNDDTKAPLVGTIPLLVSGRQSSLPSLLTTS